MEQNLPVPARQASMIGAVVAALGLLIIIVLRHRNH